MTATRSLDSLDSKATALAHGDIVIVRETTNKRTTYVLSIVPGPPQIRCRTYDRAVSTARAWASQRGGTIWVTQNGHPLIVVTPTHGSPPLRV